MNVLDTNMTTGVVRPILRPMDIFQELTKRAIEETKEEIAKTGRLSLRRFISLAWQVVEPARPYVHGWHIDAISEHLEAITTGHLIRLLINVPPGMMKSLLTCVFWPAWEWGPEARPDLRIIGFSYDTALSTRDALRCRRLMTSQWYQTSKKCPLMTQSGILYSLFQTRMPRITLPPKLA